MYPNNQSIDSADGGSDSPTLNLNEAARFIELLTGAADTPVTWHPIKADRDGNQRNEQPFDGSLYQCAAKLMRLNASGFGIFIAVNACAGGRKATDVTSVRAVFVDCDDPTANPLGLIAEADLGFDFIVESSSGKYHAYRRVDGFPIDGTLFKGAQLALADKVAGDPKICDLPRIMRVPGFIHQKVKDGVASEPFQTRIHEAAHEGRVTVWADLMEEYGWTEAGLRARAGGVVKAAATASATREGAVVPRKKASKTDWAAEAAIPRKDGDGRNSFAMGYAGHLIGTGMALAPALAALRAWNERNIEPLPADVVDSIVERLYESEQSKRPSYPLTDLGFAERFADQYGGGFRYVADGGHWIGWNGKTWQKDDGGIMLQLASSALARGLGDEASREQDEHKRKALKLFNIKQENGGFSRVADNAKHLAPFPVRALQLDAHPLLLVVDDGVVSLRTGKWSAHDQSLLMTKKTGITYQEGAECPMWRKFVDEIMGGDKDLARYLQKIVGYCLTGETSEHAMFMFLGCGSNGKSVFINTVEGILGEYAGRMEVSSLMHKKNGSAASGDIARLQGMRFVSTSEPTRGNQLNTGVVKDLVSGDTQVARFNYGELFSFKPTHKIIMATNHLPTIADTDNGIWRRVRVIPFDMVFPNVRDVGLKMADDFKREASGILNWMIEGCVAWASEGLDPIPEAVRRKTGEYRTDLDIVARFLSDACVTPDQWRGEVYRMKAPETPHFQVKALTLYTAYLEFCQAFGYPRMNNKLFAEDVRQKPGIGFKKTSASNVYTGLMVKQSWIPRRMMEDGRIGRDLGREGIIDWSHAEDVAEA